MNAGMHAIRQVGAQQVFNHVVSQYKVHCTLCRFKLLFSQVGFMNMWIELVRTEITRSSVFQII